MSTYHERGREGFDERNLAHQPPPLVHLLFRGRPIGLFEVHGVRGQLVVLGSGPVTLPLGAQVAVDDLRGVIVPGFGTSLRATVVAKGAGTVTLSLQEQTRQ